MDGVSLEPGCCRIWCVIGPLSHLSYFQGCCRKFWATLALEDHRSHLPGVAGSHLHSVLPRPPHTHCLQSLEELSPTTVCLLLAFPMGFLRLPWFQLGGLQPDHLFLSLCG